MSWKLEDKGKELILGPGLHLMLELTNCSFLLWLIQFCRYKHGIGGYLDVTKTDVFVSVESKIVTRGFKEYARE